VALAFITPAAVGFIVFFIYPLIKGVYFSFTDYSLAGSPNLVGFKNYVTMVHDPVFWTALLVTLEYVAINIISQTIVALILAVLMQRLTRSLLIRGVLLLPYLISNVVVAIVWWWMCDRLLGIVNQILPHLGIAPQAFFGSSALSIPTIALVNTWRYVGYTALLIFAGLQTIPPDLYEAAAIDGATEVQSFFRITMPLLRPVLALVLVVSITGSFQVFDTVAVTTKGAPGNATRVIYYYIYDLAFNRSHFGQASAMTVALFVLLGTIAYFQMKLMRADQSDLN